MVNEMSGRLISEIEAVLAASNQPVQPKFKQYLMVEKAGKRNNLMNIENYLLGIYALSMGQIKQDQKTGMNQPLIKVQMPQVDPKHLHELWYFCHQLPEDDPVRKVVKSSLDCFISRNPAPLDQETSDSIIHSTDRDKLIKYAIKNKQCSLMGLQSHAEEISSELQQKLNDPTTLPSEGFINPTPLYKPNQADIDHYDNLDFHSKVVHEEIPKQSGKKGPKFNHQKDESLESKVILSYGRNGNYNKPNKQHN